MSCVRLFEWVHKIESAWSGCEFMGLRAKRVGAELTDCHRLGTYSDAMLSLDDTGEDKNLKIEMASSYLLMGGVK